jgi:lipid-binding SYLF domain-containing protein
MTGLRTPLAASLLLTLTAAPLAAADREVKTVASAAETVQALSAIPLKGIPRALLHDAAGVAVIPHVVKAGLLIDGRFGRGVILVHEPNGCWGNPVFVTLSGAGVGGQAGIEETDLVLVFKTKPSLERALRGKLALGGDASIAAGPLGRETEVASDRLLKADVYSYSRSRGLFAGLSLEGAGLRVDEEANEAFYGLRGGRAADVLAYHGRQIPDVVEDLKEQLDKLSMPPVMSAPARPPSGGR